MLMMPEGKTGKTGGIPDRTEQERSGRVRRKEIHCERSDGRDCDRI